MLRHEWDWAFAGFLVAGISDGVDGFIARHFNQRSKLGAYLDPMADKLLLVSVFVVLGFMGELPLVAGHPGGQPRRADRHARCVLSTVMGNPVEMKPLMVSKANTAVQIVLAAVGACRTAPSSTDLRPAARRSHDPVRGLLTVASAAAYLVAWLRHMSGYGEGEDHSTDDELAARRGQSAAFRRQIRFWLIAAALFALFVYLFSESCCRSWPAWCWPISSIRSPTGWSGSGLSR